MAIIAFLEEVCCTALHAPVEINEFRIVCNRRLLIYVHGFEDHVLSSLNEW